MAVTVKNNLSALNILNTLNKHSSTLTDSLRKISSGTKIPGAESGASEYAISERMRTQIRALGQDVQNVQNGSSLLKIASGGIDNIIEELRNLKELALNSANDHNTDEDRATLQKEFNHRIANIDDIATTTNYNGKLLLNGNYYRKLVPNIVMIEPNQIVQTLTGTTISADGTYIIPSGFSGTVDIANGAKNVQIKQENPAEILHDVYIVGPSGGGANIWINGLNIQNEQDGSIIKFQGADNYLTVVGNNVINYTSNTTNYNKAVINIGDGLTLEGTGKLSIKNVGVMGCAGIGVDEGDNSSATLTVNSGEYDIFINFDGAAIGTSVRSSMGDITINGGKIKAHSYSGAGIGSCGFPNESDAGSHVGNILIGKKAIIEATSTYGAGIGSGMLNASADNIKISKYAAVTASSVHGENIGKGYRGFVGGVITDWDDSNVDYGNYVWKGNPLVIHHGTKSNQALNVYINDMHIKAMGLDKTKVTTRDFATASLGEIDSAIDYALDEATYVGAYISRLEFTENNLVTAGENMQASESTIRDADIAKEVMHFAGANVMAQAAQSMLAQANQNASNVLNLLQ